MYEEESKPTINIKREDKPTKQIIGIAKNRRRKNAVNKLNITQFQSQPFEKQVDDYFSGKMPKNETNLYLGEAPKILLKNGIVNKKMVMSILVLKKAIEIGTDKHHIPIETIKKLCKYIKKPLLILKGSVDSSIVEIIELKDDLGREILVSVRLNAKENHLDVSRITSAYGKKGLKSYVINHSKDIIDMYNEKKTASWLASYGLQLSKLSNSQSSYAYSITKSCN